MKIRELKEGDIITGLSNDNGPINLTYMGMDGVYGKFAIEGVYGYVNFVDCDAELKKVSDGIYQII